MMNEQNDAYADRPKFARLFELLDEIGPIADEDWDVERYTSEWPERLSLQALDAESS
jgi:hypothetical protein